MEDGERIFGSAMSFFENVIGVASDAVEVVVDDNGKLVNGWLKWVKAKRVAHYDPETGRFLT
jgi:hypothetical protein